jgi:hypothetical protein
MVLTGMLWRRDIAPLCCPGCQYLSKLTRLSQAGLQLRFGLVGEVRLPSLSWLVDDQQQLLHHGRLCVVTNVSPNSSCCQHDFHDDAVQGTQRQDGYLLVTAVDLLAC